MHAALESAKVAVLLVSAHFFASDFIIKNELQPLLETARKNGVRIMWIAVSASAYLKSEINDYQALNDPNKPLDTLPNPGAMISLSKSQMKSPKLLSDEKNHV
jgi:hypothetical protein